MHRFVVALVFAVAATSCGGVTEPGVLSGTWAVTAKGMISGDVTCYDSKSTYELSQRGTSIRGAEPSGTAAVCTAPGSLGLAVTSFPAEITSGRLDGSSVSFTATHSTFGPMSQVQFLLLESEFVGELDSTKITGTAKWTCRKIADGSTVVFTGSFEATRVP